MTYFSKKTIEYKLCTTRAYRKALLNLLEKGKDVYNLGISHKHCSVLHRADGYSYLSKTCVPLGFEKPSIRAHEAS
jgi:hypothetical protein